MQTIDSLPVTGEERITYAVLFYDLGVKIAPCKSGTKEFLPGYGPYLKHIEDDLDLMKYFQEGNYNYALLTGTGPGLVVIDFDDLDVYQLFKNEAGKLAETFTVKSGRGVHVYYFSQDLRAWRGAGFEVMGVHKAVMGPLCKHPTGAIYTPLNRPYIRRIETLADFPLLSKKPELPLPPIKKPVHLEGGIVQKIKGQYSIYEEITKRGELSARVKLRSSDGGKGRWYMGFCPFHEDHNKRSFWVDTERNIYGCRACDVKGDVINLLSLLSGETVQEVINRLGAAL